MSAFVDTNILLYAVLPDPSNAAKRAIARTILAADNISLSMQVVQEFTAQATRPTRANALSLDEAERMVAVCDKSEITEADLPLEVQLAALEAREADPAESVLDQAVAAFERSYLLKALEKGEWNIAGTARQLRLPLSTLKHRMSRLGLNDVTRRLRDA